MYVCIYNTIQYIMRSVSALGHARLVSVYRVETIIYFDFKKNLASIHRGEESTYNEMYNL